MGKNWRVADEQLNETAEIQLFLDVHANFKNNVMSLVISLQLLFNLSLSLLGT